MGSALSGTRSYTASEESRASFPNRRQYETATQVRSALLASGFEACELIVGVSFAKTNLWNGKVCFGGRCLHVIDGSMNPYMVALSMIAKTLSVYDDDCDIPCYGFGDAATKGEKVFSFFPGNQRAGGLEALQERYKQIAASVDMSGPTSFAPLIRQAVRDVYNSGMKFHVLLILADGQISEEGRVETEKAIVEACEFPLSIVMIGVGDGPWNAIHEFDNGLPERSWDNFHFFDFSEIVKGQAFVPEQQLNDVFELNVLEELPAQFESARPLTGEHNQSRVAHLIRDIPFDLVNDPPTAITAPLPSQHDSA